MQINFNEEQDKIHYLQHIFKKVFYCFMITLDYYAKHITQKKVAAT